jgi:hypothetical protein
VFQKPVASGFSRKDVCGARMLCNIEPKIYGHSAIHRETSPLATALFRNQIIAIARRRLTIWVDC